MELSMKVAGGVDVDAMDVEPPVACSVTRIPFPSMK
jgi:hypothetical protein